MTFLWLIVWLCANSPTPDQGPDWFYALGVCGVIDLFGLFRRTADDK